MPLALSFSLSPLFPFSLTHSCGLSFLVSSFALHSFILSLLSIFSFLLCAILIVSQSSRSSVTERSDSDWLTPCLRLFHLSPWHLSAYMRGSIPFLQYILLHSLNPSFDFSISFPFAYSFPPPLIDLCCFLSYFFPQFVSLFPFLLPFQQLCFSSHCLGVQCSLSSRQPSWLIPLLFFFFFHSSTPHSISFQSSYTFGMVPLDVKVSVAEVLEVCIVWFTVWITSYFRCEHQVWMPLSCCRWPWQLVKSFPNAPKDLHSTLKMSSSTATALSRLGYYLFFLILILHFVFFPVVYLSVFAKN